MKINNQNNGATAAQATFENVDIEREPVGNRGLIVTRTHLLNQIKVHGAQAGITVVCAPVGMGKTALLLQYVAVVKSDPARGEARLISGSKLDASQLFEELRSLKDSLAGAMHPLIAIDDMPVLSKTALEAFPDLIRAFRETGFEFIVSCTPANQGLLVALGDSYKIGAQALLVRPREYPEWVRTFCIDRTLDMYGLSQGIPSLVTALQDLGGTNRDDIQLRLEVFKLYQTALKDIRSYDQDMFHLACLLLLLKKGSFISLIRDDCNVKSEIIARLAHDYPMFGINSEQSSYCCLALDSKGERLLVELVADKQPACIEQALRILMQTHRVDDAVALANTLDNTKVFQLLLSTWPLDFALSGNIAFVQHAAAQIGGEQATKASVTITVALYAAALVSGEYRAARAAARELFCRADELQQLDQQTLQTLYALAAAWESCAGTSLPEIRYDPAIHKEKSAAALLRRHKELWHNIMTGKEDPYVPNKAETHWDIGTNKIDIPSTLLLCDTLIDNALHGSMTNARDIDAQLQNLASDLRSHKALPIADRVRMTGAVCRLMEGLPIKDERAFVDAGTASVRTSDLAMQLFCLVAEGWQDMDEGQVVNARFRAQQVLRLAEPSLEMVRDWATLLDRCAYICNEAKLALCEEADVIELTQESIAPVEAWSTALLLAAAGHTAELSAWYSMHKTAMLETWFRPQACQAMRAIGNKADSIRRMLPTSYTDEVDMLTLTGNAAPRLSIVQNESQLTLHDEQIDIQLFGGFKVMRNGHVLTEGLWRRKRLCALASRLILAQGGFVDRRVLTEEMWPDSDYGKARENLYSALSGLRSALGQRETGPQYVLTQGDGVALNSEYVSSDVSKFERIARDVLLKRTGTSGRQIIESCLKMEELYIGPLYICEIGSMTYHQRQRKLFLSKFVDCMLRGVEAALELEDLPTASWLIAAAQRQAPYREDVMRQMMYLYDRSGRRKEIIEMYSSHLHYLQQVVHAEPERETRMAYEAIMERNRLVSMI